MDMGGFTIMQLPHSKAQASYTEQVKIIEANLKNAAAGEKNNALLQQLQKRLDALAEKYQYNEEIGIARYKLYELQALLHYLNGNADDALDFIDQAIEMRGDNYPRAEQLKAQLLASPQALTTTTIEPINMTKQERRKKLIGLEGWLALFIVSVSLGILLEVINLVGYGSTFNDLVSFQGDAPDFVAAMNPVLWFEILTNVLSIGWALLLIVLLAQRKKLAKDIAVVYLVLNAVFLIIDYVWAASVFDTFNVTQYVQTELSDAMRDVAKGVLAVFVWTPYFLVSKRVKATLTK